MIVTPIEKIRDFISLNPHFEKAFTFLEKVYKEGFPEGRYPIEGDKIIAIVQTSKGVTKKEAKLEVHRKYIDIQYTMEGEDLVGIRETSLCHEVEMPYNEEIDKALYRDKPLFWVPTNERNVCIFFPCDGHAPFVSRGKMKKLILKVAVDSV
jgi:biofilm protein TabA